MCERVVAADDFQPFDLRGVQPGQMFKPQVVGATTGSDTKFPARSAKFHAYEFVDVEVDLGEVGDVPEVIERPWEVVLDCALE